MHEEIALISPPAPQPPDRVPALEPNHMQVLTEFEMHAEVACRKLFGEIHRIIVMVDRLQSASWAMTNLQLRRGTRLGQPRILTPPKLKRGSLPFAAGNNKLDC